MSVRKHLFIEGRVQGVTFRASTRRMADKLGLDGWVRNLSDGGVEAVFEGDREDVERMVDWCRRGPAPAKVENVREKDEQPVGLEGFEIKY